MPATNAKRAQGNESRRRLLKATAELVSEGGYSAASVSAIAARAGVVKSALYWHFKNKDGMLLAALGEHTESWVVEIESAVSGTSDPTKRLDGLLEHIRDLILSRPDLRRMIFSLLLERGHHDNEIREAVASVFRRLRAALTKGFSDVLPIPAERLSIITDGIINMSDGAFLSYLADPSEEALDAKLGEIRRMVMLRIAHELQKQGKR
jgi:AcrR family transcriptional regulator